MTVAKGITSAYVPLSACLVSEKVWRVLRRRQRQVRRFGHGYTYTSHPLAAAAALTNLDIIERDGLLQKPGNGAYLREQLRAAFEDHPLVGRGARPRHDRRGRVCDTWQHLRRSTRR